MSTVFINPYASSIYINFPDPEWTLIRIYLTMFIERRGKARSYESLILTLINTAPAHSLPVTASDTMANVFWFLSSTTGETVDQ